MLAASYGLALHGSGVARVRAGLHYIAINLAASLLFLIGVSLIYGVTGTLNMADLASRIAAHRRRGPGAAGGRRGDPRHRLPGQGGMWPLGFWLPADLCRGQRRRSAAIFAILSKVGIYTVLRLSLLLFGEEAGASAGFGGTWLLVGGMADHRLRRDRRCWRRRTWRGWPAPACWSPPARCWRPSASAQVAVTGGALFYLVSSTLAIGAFFLLIELVERGREIGADVLAVTLEAFGDGEDEDRERRARSASPSPAPWRSSASASCACALLLAGLPPLSGFVAKFAMLAGMLNPGGLGRGRSRSSPSGWALLAALLPLGPRHGAGHDPRRHPQPSGHHRTQRCRAVGVMEIAPVAAAARPLRRA